IRPCLPWSWWVNDARPLARGSSSRANVGRRPCRKGLPRSSVASERVFGRRERPAGGAPARTQTSDRDGGERSPALSPTRGRHAEAPPPTRWPFVGAPPAAGVSPPAPEPFAVARGLAGRY